MCTAGGGGVGLVGLVGVDPTLEALEPLADELAPPNGSAAVPWRVTAVGGLPSRTASSSAGEGSPAGIFTLAGATGVPGGVVTLLRMIDAPIGTANARSTRSTTAGRICRSRRSVSMPRISFMAWWGWRP